MEKDKKKRGGKRPLRLDNILMSIWEDLENPASFSTPYILWKAVRVKKPDVSFQAVKNWLSGVDSYTLFKPFNSKYKRRKVLCRGINYMWQCDLMEVQEIAKENKGNRYLLPIIDCFSRFVYILPLKDKKSTTVANAFQQVLNRNKVKPLKVQTDKGTEFTGAPFQSMCLKNGIHHYHTHQQVKAQIVERFNKTFKMKMIKYFKSQKTLRYTNVLQTIVSTYNRTKHSAIGVAPIDVTLKNQTEIYNYQYGKYLAEKVKLPKFKINDQVRLYSWRKQFKRGYDKNFTEEIFYISDSHPTNPVTYTIRDKDNEIIEGAVYEPELVQVNINQTPN
jgi:transposase InsO family protein